MKPVRISSINRKQLKRTNVLSAQSLEEKVELLIYRDLRRIGWNSCSSKGKIELTPPEEYDKQVIKDSMSIKREEILLKNKNWIDQHMDLAIENLAEGKDVLNSSIKPNIELCNSTKQHDLFRMLRYFWSAPYSEYVGRRMRFIIRDYALPKKPVIGIAALGSPIIHIPDRDTFIGWDTATRTKMLNHMMDAYVIGALPPYSYLLGGKLIAYLLASNEVRGIYGEKYKGKKYNQLAGIFTTSLYGKSSLYNKIRYKNRCLYKFIGQTKGYGTFHLTNETFVAMNEMLKENGIIISNVFGNGPIWRMRVIRTASDFLGIDTDGLLNHSFKRGIYYVPFAKNTQLFLTGKNKALRYYGQSAANLTSYWKNRWLDRRKRNLDIVRSVENYSTKSFKILP